MKLAEKIFNERKKLGMSQEQFAESMEVSRQAVSKWESGQSMPDLDKLILMSRIFNVSTDYLLKEEQEGFYEETVSYNEAVSYNESTAYSESNTDNNAFYMEKSSTIGRVSKEKSAFEKEMENARELNKDEVEEYRDTYNWSMKRIARGVFLVVFGVGVSSLLDILTNIEVVPEAITDGAMAVSILLFVLIAVRYFILSGMRLEKYEYLQKEKFILPEGIKNQLEAEDRDYQNTFIHKISLGVGLIIFGVIACIICDSIGEAMNITILEDDIGGAILLIAVATGVYNLIITSMTKEFYNILLQREDYTVKNKKKNEEYEKTIGLVAGVFWTLVAAAYLGYSLITNDWGKSWVIFPVAGCIFGAIAVFLQLKNSVKEMKSET